MAVLTKNLPDTRRIPTFPVMQFTLERYHESIKLGALGPSDKLELIDGWLVPKMPQNTAHATSLAMLQKALMKRLTDDWDLRTESPITLSGDNEPEPISPSSWLPLTTISSRIRLKKTLVCLWKLPIHLFVTIKSQS